MSFRVVQSASGVGSGTTASATLISTVSTSNVVIAIVSCYASSQRFATFTLADNKVGNVYTALDGSGQVVERGTAGTYFCVGAFICKPANGGPSFTVTATSSIGGVGLALMEVSYTGPIPQLYSSGQGTGTASPATVANAVTYGNSLVINWCAQGNVATTLWTPGAGYTAVQNAPYPTSFGYLVQYLANTTTNPISPSATLAGITEWASVSWSLSEMPTAKTYYVATAGSDSNNGTTTSTPFQTISHAASVAVFGDTILLNGGDTFAGEITFTFGVMIESYGTGRATVTSAALNKSAFLFEACSGVTVNNLVLVGAGDVVTDTTGLGLLLFQNTTLNGFYNATVTNCDVSQAPHGIWMTNSSGQTPGTRWGFVNFSNNVVHEIAIQGIHFTPGNTLSLNYFFTGVTVSNNSVTNVIGTPLTEINGIYFESCYNVTCNYNYVNGVAINWNNTDGQPGPGGIGFYCCANFRAVGNVVGNIYSSSADGNGLDFDEDTYNGTFLYNFVFNCQGPGLLCDAGYYASGNVAAFNIFVDNALNHEGVIWVNAPDGTTIYNNTIIQLTSTNPTIIFTTGAQNGLRFLNNIFVTPSGSTTVNIPSGSGLTLEGNAYLSGTGFKCTYNGTAYTTLPNFRSASGQESPSNGFSLTADPCLKPSPIPTVTIPDFGAAQAYSLPVGSALLTAGLNVSTGYSVTPPALDIFGTAITAATLPVGAVKGALSYMLSGPTSGMAGTTSTNFAITASANDFDTITLSDGAGGTFVPSSLTVTGTTPVTFTYTNGAAGVYTLTLTSGLGAPVPSSPWTYTTQTSYTWAFVQSTTLPVNNSSVTSKAISLSGVKAGDVLVVATTAGGGTVSSITDSVGNTYHKIANKYYVFDADLWYANATTGGSVTTTVNWSGAVTGALAIAEYSPPAGSTITVDNSNTSNGSGTAASVTSLTKTGIDLAIMVANMGNYSAPSSAPTAGSGWTLRRYSGSGQASGLVFQDQLNPASSPVAASLTLASSGSWAAVGATLLATLPPYELLGPVGVAVGTTATLTLAPTVMLTDTITISTSFPGTLSKVSLTFTASSSAQTFTFTPSVAGLATITLTSSNGYTIGSAPYLLGSFVNFTLTGPAVDGTAGVPSTFTLTPASATTDVVTLTDDSGGTFLPTSLSWTSSAAAKTFQYTPPAYGTQVITAVSQDGGAVAGSPFTLASVAVVVAACLFKSGKTLVFGVDGSGNPTNGIYPPALVLSVNSNPTVSVNGATIAINGPMYNDVSQTSSRVGYLAICGSVESIPMSNGGANYSAPAATWNGDGGGSGLTVGTPTMQTGVTSYTIGSGALAGSGMVDGGYSIAMWQPQGTIGGSPTGVMATAYITVSGGKFTACVPASGSPIAYGGGYTASFSSSTFMPSGILPNNNFRLTQATLSGSNTIYTGALGAGASGGLVGSSFAISGFSNSGNNGTFTVTASTATTITVANSSGVNKTEAAIGENTSATGATIECNVSKYITGIPVTNGGSGFTSAPTFAITDGGSGSGAAAAPIMTGPLSTDVLTYSWAAGAFMTSQGPTPVATNMPIVNSRGALEGPVGNSIGFTAAPTMPMGATIQAYSTYTVSNICPLKNKYLANGGWSGPGLIKNTGTYYPVSWTPGGTISAEFGLSFYDGTTKVLFGTYTLVYDDEYYAPGSGLPGPTGMALAAALGCTCNLISSSRSGTTVTQFWDVESTLSSTAGIFVFVKVQATAPSDGLWHISDLAIFVPGDSIDRTPFAIDDNWVTAMTAPDGTGPGSLRFMANFGGQSGFNNVVDVSDIPSSSLSSFDVPYVNNIPTAAPNVGGGLPSGSFTVAAIRKISTDGTLPWVSTKLYSGSLTTQATWAVSGTDATLGSYLSMTDGPLLTADNGTIAIINGGGANQAVMELRTTAAHGLKTGQYVTLLGTYPTIPLSQSGNTVLPASSTLMFPVLVTGPTTFVINNYLIPASGSTTQTINSSSEISTPGLTGTLSCPWSHNYVPYESLFTMTARWPKTIAWLNISPIGTAGYFQHVIGLANQYLGAGNKVYLEFGNEPWNSGAPLQYIFEGIAARFSQYAPNGVPFLTYASNAANMVVGDGSIYNAVATANAFAICQTEWVSLGRSADDIKLIYSVQQAYNYRTSKVLQAYNDYHIPAGFLAIAAYTSSNTGLRPGQTTAIQAASAAGSAAIDSPGNWPLDAYLDLFRAILFYDTQWWDNFSGNLAGMPSGFSNIVYECATDGLIDWQTTPLAFWAIEDCLYNPAFKDVQWCYYLMLQRGDPRVPGTGAEIANYFTLNDVLGTTPGAPDSTRGGQIGSHGELWRIEDSIYTPVGPGTGNYFLTPQGGAKGADASHSYTYGSVNESPGVQAWVDWNAAVSGLGPPAVSSTSPANGAAGVAVGAVISLVFTETMNAATVTNASLTVSTGGSNITGTIAYNAGTDTASFTPAFSLLYSTTYTITATTAIQNAAGTPLAAASVTTFTTAAAPAPTVVTVSPSSGATAIAVGTTVALTFSEAMNAATITTANITVGTGSAVAATIGFNTGTFVATLTPSSPLVHSTEYTITATTAVQSSGGAFLGSTFTSTFTTVAAPPLSAVSSTPADGATGTSLSPLITIVFNEALNPLSANLMTITLKEGSTPVVCTVNYNATTFTVMLNPTVVLAPATVYTITATTGVESAGGAFLGSPFTANFTTGAAVAATVRNKRWFPGLRVPGY